MTADWRLNLEGEYILKSKMAKTTKKNTNSGVIVKSMQYSIITRVVNFNPNKLSSKTIVVDGKAAIRLKGRVYTEVKA